MTERRISIAVVFGGRSSEHEVSCHSAQSVLAHLDPDRYDVLPVRIDPDGRWSVGDRQTPDGVVDSIVAALPILRHVDLVFPVLHGLYGEDGTLQALLEHANIPYLGNGVFAGAVGMDKEFTKRLLVAEGLTVADGVLLLPQTDTLSPQQREWLGLPVFVKPARAGSSVGVSKVDEWADLPAAVAQARKLDSRVLVEAAVVGREIDVAVLEHPDGRIEAGPPLEIRVNEGHRFFDYEAKYHGGGAVFDIPALLDPATTALIQEHAVRAFRALDCAGLLRVDFFLRDGVPVVNEVNTFPGFTAESQYPRIWQRAGLEFPALLDVLIATALARHQPHQAPDVT